MRKLTKKDITRQDYVDNAIYDMLKDISISDNIDWNIEMIGQIRDIAADWIVNRLKLCPEQDFYPSFNDTD